MTESFDIDALFSGNSHEERAAKSPDDYFNQHGLDVLRVINDVKRLGPIARGSNGGLWYYASGVWRERGADELVRRVGDLLGGRFRNSHLRNVETLLLSDHARITGEPHQRYINVINGMLRWNDAKLEQHRPDLYSAVQLPVLWNPDATCPAIDDWLVDVLPSDAHEFIDEVLGYLVLNGNPLHVAMLLLGNGRNGKGTFLRLVTKMLGAANVANTPLQTLADNRFAAASLYGKLANICGDLDARMLERSDTFKMATGGDTLYAERKYGAPFAFNPWATMLFSANQAPPSKDTSAGYYARWVIVPFSADLRGRIRPQSDLEEALHAQDELDGLFARSVAGLQRLMARGHFTPPPSALAAHEEFRRTTDPVAAFIADCLEIRDGLATPRTDVYDRYRAWSGASGDSPSRPPTSTGVWNRYQVSPEDSSTDCGGWSASARVESGDVHQCAGGAGGAADLSLIRSHRR